MTALAFVMLSVAMMAGWPALMEIQFDVETRNHAEIHIEDLPAIMRCKEDPNHDEIVMIVTRDRRGTPKKILNICTLETENGLLVVFEPFLRNGHVFQQLTAYVKDTITSKAALDTYLWIKGCQWVEKWLFLKIMEGK